MSSKNVEKVRAYLATWDGEMLRPDRRSLDRIVSMAFTGDLFAPDAVYEDAVLPDHVGESYRGLDGILRAARSWLEPFEWLILELKEIVDTDDCVVSLHRARMKMQHTEIEFESPLAYVFTFQDGKVIHQRAFVDHAEALEAVGLQE